MTENLAKLPVKSILRKSSLTFIEHDDSDLQSFLDAQKPTKVIVEPVEIPKEYPGETEEEKARRDEFELKRKLNRHQEAMKVALAKKMLSQEENIEEETPQDLPDDDDDCCRDVDDTTRNDDDMERQPAV